MAREPIRLLLLAGVLGLVLRQKAPLGQRTPAAPDDARVEEESAGMAARFAHGEGKARTGQPGRPELRGQASRDDARFGAAPLAQRR